MVHSMRNIVDTYSIGPEDSTYLVMPLFHVHGLMAGLMAPLAARAAVALPAGGRFSAAAFWRDFDACSATWYTAVPTIHQILLARTRSAAATAAERGYMADAVSRIRFVRSCSSSLAPSVLAELESLCGSTVCEAYAMTEACHQMTSNPLAPPNARRPGTVGRATRLGVRVGVLDTLGPSPLLEAPFACWPPRPWRRRLQTFCLAMMQRRRQTNLVKYASKVQRCLQGTWAHQRAKPMLSLSRARFGLAPCRPRTARAAAWPSHICSARRPKAHGFGLVILGP